jgi:hypothetical protein
MERMSGLKVKSAIADDTHISLIIIKFVPSEEVETTKII